MKILITGGAGFIGSQLGFRFLQTGHDVTLIDNLKYGYLDNLVQNGQPFPKFVCLDVRDPLIEKNLVGVDVVYHLAGISSLPECQANPAEAYGSNVVGTANVLEMARRQGVKRVVFSSSSAIYENETVYPTPESIESHPTLIYCQTKKQAEELCQSFRQAYGLDITIVRFYNVYGPHMDYRRPNPPLVSYIIKCLLNQEVPLLHVQSEAASRDMIYVDDVLDLLEIIMTHPKAKNDVFNVGLGETASVPKVYQIIAAAFHETKIKPTFRDPQKLWERYPTLFSQKYGLKPEILINEVSKHTLCDTSKAEKLLSWKAKTSIKVGLTKTVKEIKKLHQR